MVCIYQIFYISYAASYELCISSSDIPRIYLTPGANILTTLPQHDINFSFITSYSWTYWCVNRINFSQSVICHFKDQLCQTPWQLTQVIFPPCLLPASHRRAQSRPCGAASPLQLGQGGARQPAGLLRALPPDKLNREARREAEKEAESKRKLYRYYSSSYEVCQKKSIIPFNSVMTFSGIRHWAYIV